MRRRLQIGVVAALIGAAAGAPSATALFEQGVAAGEIKARSAKLWTRVGEFGRKKLEVASDARFRRLVHRERLKVPGAADTTLQRTVRGLRPGREYWYRFCTAGRCSAKGHFETAIRPGSSAKLSFALTGDADATHAAGESQPFFGEFDAFKSMRKEGNDFNVFIGDTIYSDSGVAGPPALTRSEKWQKYLLGLEQKSLRKLRKSAGIYTHWDDHEFINDFSRAENGEALYKAGVKAFRDYSPVGYSKRDGLYRSFRWGKTAEVFFLDQRSFRDAKASAGGTCDNPGTGSPDLAPTAPDDKRATFSLLIPSLANPVAPACLAAINDPDRTFLGGRQLRNFIADVKASKARWKLVMNETPLQQFYGLPYDRWEGYAYERVMLLNELSKISDGDIAFFTTDTHASFVNVIRERTFDDDVAPANAGPVASDSPFQDFIVGPVGTNTFWAEIDAVTGGDGNGELLSAAFFKPAPPTGVGMACSQGDQNSYAQVTATKNKLRVEYKAEDGSEVTDVDDSRCGPYVLKR